MASGRRKGDWLMQQHALSSFKNSSSPLKGSERFWKIGFVFMGIKNRKEHLSPDWFPK